MKQKLLFIFIFCAVYISHSQEKIIIPSNQFNIDSTKFLIVTNLDVDYVNSNWVNEKSSIALDTIYNLEPPVTTIKLGIPYKLVNSVNGKIYNLYFTKLPLVTITTDSIIGNEPSVLANFKLIDTDQKLITSYIGIQYRGAYSQTLPKKSFEIEFWDDKTGTESRDVSLLGMHSDDGFNLQAMYNEPLRFHSKTNNDLWRMIHKPYYIKSEPEAVSGIEMKYAELFLNGVYRGIYCIGEKVNRKLLKLKKYSGNIKGELYKGDEWGTSTLFSLLTPYDNNELLWGGFEYKHPKEATDWMNIYNFVDFVINETDGSFNAHYKTKFELNNAVDYFIFLNLIRATDNRGKNLYIAKYNTNEPYFYVPWDLDGTFGTIWNGQHENTTNDILSNGLYERLLNDCSEEGFRKKLNLRWQELRSTFIDHDKLIEMLKSNYTFLKQNGIYEREHIAWPDYNPDENEIDYISNWLIDRLNYLDIKFSETCNTLDVATFDQVSKMIVYPNPTSDIIYISLRNNVNHSIFLYDSTGKLILIKYSQQNQDNISIKDLAKGIYYVKIVDSENKIDVKSIIKK